MSCGASVRHYIVQSPHKPALNANLCGHCANNILFIDFAWAVSTEDLSKACACGVFQFNRTKSNWPCGL